MYTCVWVPFRKSVASGPQCSDARKGGGHAAQAALPLVPARVENACQPNASFMFGTAVPLWRKNRGRARGRRDRKERLRSSLNCRCTKLIVGSPPNLL